MSTGDIIILAVVAAAVIFAGITSYRRKKNGSGCCGDCASCQGCGRSEKK